MGNLNYDIARLEDGQIAGPRTINPIVDYILGYQSTSDFLNINPNGRGSVEFDLDFEGMAKAILAMVAGMMQDGAALDFDFRVSVEEGVLSVQGGTVYLPDNSVAISALTHNLDPQEDSGKMIYVRLTGATAGSLQFGGAVTHTLQTGDGNFRATLPVATLSYSGGAWQVRYRHLGAFVLAHTPYFWIPGYGRGRAQALMHRADEDGLRWVDYATCDDESASA